jgi:hypothetical protein
MADEQNTENQEEQNSGQEQNDTAAEMAALKELLEDTNKSIASLKKDNEELKKLNFKLAMQAERSEVQQKSVEDCLHECFMPTMKK